MNASTTSAPAVVFIHGLAADHTVWWPVMDAMDAVGSFITQSISLPGHGGQETDRRPSFGSYAAHVADRVEVDTDELVVVGHSLGALVAAVLAGGMFGHKVSGFVGVAPKISWTDAEVAASAERAARGRRYFPTAGEAARAMWRTSGETAHDLERTPERLQLVRGPSGGYAGVFDPAASPTGLLGSSANGIIDAALANVRCPMRLIVGSEDPGTSVEELRRYDRGAVQLDGLGHNPHVESPTTLARLIVEFMGGQR